VRRKAGPNRDDLAIADLNVDEAIEPGTGIENSSAPNGPVVLHQPVPALK